MSSRDSVGIDFGTSNCVAGYLSNDGVVLAQLTNDGPYLPSVLYADTTDMSEVSVADNDPELLKRMARARGQKSQEKRRASDAVPFGAVGGTTLGQRELTSAERLVLEKAALLRERLAERQARSRARTTEQLLLGATEVLVGEDAVRAHLRNPSIGAYFRSPKRFLGSDLRRGHLFVFQRVVAAMLTHIRERLAATLNTDPVNVVLGRPVTYSDVSGDSGDAQAVSIMRTAAHEAGFQNVEFLLEPVAAALEYERTLSSDRTVLVIDAGGGTTDCTMMRLGPSRRSAIDRTRDVVSFAGVKSGGVDVDQQIAWQRFTPAFGRNTLAKNGLPLPYHHYANAVACYDVPMQAEFYASEAEIAAMLDSAERPDLVLHLQRLCTHRLTARLGRSAELTKIALSEKTNVQVPLHYLANDLNVPVNRAHLSAAADHFLTRLVEVARETVRNADVQPDTIFVTGGTARSPVIESALRERLGMKAPIVIGDLFGSVASGLALQASRLF